MQASSAPTKVPLPFANSGTKNTIPTASQIGITAGAASLTDGFPPLTRTPIAAGGVPPSGADMNGILNLLSANIMWENAGAFMAYDSAFSTAIGGYPKGALLAKSGNNGLWLNTVDNNTSNPDSGGANWVDALGGRLLSVQNFAANGTYTRNPNATLVRIRIIGGGGGGGSTAATSTGQTCICGGGGSGSFVEALYAASAIGASQAITIAANSSAGGNGNASSVGSLITVPGGGAGAALFGTTTNSVIASAGVAGPAPTVTGSPIYAIAMRGTTGGPGFSINGTLLSGAGASGMFGQGGQGGSAGGAGATGLTYGAGGSGAAAGPSTSILLGGTGFNGYCIIEEFA